MLEKKFKAVEEWAMYGGGKGRERRGEEKRILGLLECAEGEGAPVSQEEEEAGWTPTLPNTRTLHILQQGKDWKLIQGECSFI